MSSKKIRVLGLYIFLFGPATSSLSPFPIGSFFLSFSPLLRCIRHEVIFSAVFRVKGTQDPKQAPCRKAQSFSFTG